jgi:isoquinoline 1-oxidoreductase subunit alpha
MISLTINGKAYSLDVEAETPLLWVIRDECDVANKAITTIEGLSPDARHPVQQAWLAEDVPQCGYCQSGQIMAAAAFLKQYPRPTPIATQTSPISAVAEPMFASAAPSIAPQN